MSYLRRGALWRLCDCGVGLTRYRAEHTESGSQCLLFPVARLVVGTGRAASFHMASPTVRAKWRGALGANTKTGGSGRVSDEHKHKDTPTQTHNVNNKPHTQTHNNPSSFSLGTWVALLAFSAPRTAASSLNIQCTHPPQSKSDHAGLLPILNDNSCRWLTVYSENREVKDHRTINRKFLLIFSFFFSPENHPCDTFRLVFTCRMKWPPLLTEG